MSFPWTVPNGPMVCLTPVDGSYPFQTKYISLTAKTVLGAGDGATPKTQPREARPSNGWFDASRDSKGGPLTLGATHAEVWLEGGKVQLRDLDSAFGTYVNGTRVTLTTLKNGDIVALGTKVERNPKTPRNVTNEQMLNVAAEVTIVGVP